MREQKPKKIGGSSSHCKQLLSLEISCTSKDLYHHKIVRHFPVIDYVGALERGDGKPELCPHMFGFKRKRTPEHYFAADGGCTQEVLEPTVKMSKHKIKEPKNKIND